MPPSGSLGKSDSLTGVPEVLARGPYLRPAPRVLPCDSVSKGQKPHLTNVIWGCLEDLLASNNAGKMLVQVHRCVISCAGSLNIYPLWIAEDNCIANCETRCVLDEGRAPAGPFAVLCDPSLIQQMLTVRRLCVRYYGRCRRRGGGAGQVPVRTGPWCPEVPIVCPGLASLPCTRNGTRHVPSLQESRESLSVFQGSDENPS